jgi:hypothetical protein
MKRSGGQIRINFLAWFTELQGIEPHPDFLLAIETIYSAILFSLFMPLNIPPYCFF